MSDQKPEQSEPKWVNDTDHVASVVGESVCGIAIFMCEAMLAHRIEPQYLPAFVRAHNALVEADTELTSIIKDFRDTPPPPPAKKIRVPSLITEYRAVEEE